jgi:hypothetical protein
VPPQTPRFYTPRECARPVTDFSSPACSNMVVSESQPFAHTHS